MHCRQLHHINSGFYTTVSCSLYPHLAPTSVHPCPFLPYISFNYRHRSTASVILLLTLIETLVVCFFAFWFFFRDPALAELLESTNPDLSVTSLTQTNASLLFFCSSFPTTCNLLAVPLPHPMLSDVLSKYYSVSLSSHLTQLKDIFLPFLQISVEFTTCNAY